MDLTGAVWRKSSRSGTNGGNCVEVTDLERAVAVRDSKDPGGSKLGFARDQWVAFTTAVKRGRFDLRS
ncbi:MAG: DUF397 domain-containing protein [Streptosporangiaceae bacterium]